MSLVKSVAGHRKGVWSGVLVACLAAVPVAFAVLHQGFPVTDVTLDAKDVWVTNGHSLQLGRLDRQIEELDGAVSGASADLDVAQNGSNVFLFDPARGDISRVDPAYTELVEPARMPVGSHVALGGDTLAITAPDGRLWAVDIANGLTFDPSQRPALKLGAGGQAVVTASGAVVAISPKDQELFRIDAPGAPATQRGIAVPENAQLAPAGDRAVVFAPGSRTLERDDGTSIALPVAAQQLQLTGDSDEVALASGDRLLVVRLGDGSVRSIPAHLARPVADANGITRPVVVAGCAHGAWAAAQRYLLACDGERPRAEDIDQATQGERLRFRVNGDVVALNDPSLRKSLKDKGIVEDFTVPNEKQVDDGKTLDIAYAKPSDVASQVIVWNTSMVKDADAPKSYADLLDPQWKGKFGMTAIQTGLSSITVAKSIWDGLGPEKMKQFGAAQPKIYTSVVPLTQAVVRGEIPVAITDLSITQGYIDDGSPLAWAAPTEGTPTWSSAQMIPKSSEHQACAKIFVAWSASMRGADAVWKDTKFLSYRTIDDRPSDAPDIGTPYFVDTKWLLKNRDAFVKQWSSVVAQGQ